MLGAFHSLLALAGLVLALSVMRLNPLRQRAIVWTSDGILMLLSSVMDCCNANSRTLASSTPPVCVRVYVCLGEGY